MNTLIAVDKSSSFRIYLAVTTKMAENARKVHDTSPLASAALGRVLTSAGLMGIMLLKDKKDKLTVQFKGDGPAGEILATAGSTGKVKGYISNPIVDLPLKPDGKLDVGTALGKGTVTVIRDSGLKEPYMGRIDMVSGEIAEDLTAYFFLSEQQSTSVALGVKIGRDCSVIAAGGMIIQMLPDNDPLSVGALEHLLANLPPLTDLIEEESKKETPLAILSGLADRIFLELPKEYRPEILEYKNMEWDCDCSFERLERVLLSLGEKELRTILEEDGQAELVCQFCRGKYHFDKEHLAMLLRVAVKSKEIMEGKRKCSRNSRNSP